MIPVKQNIILIDMAETHCRIQKELYTIIGNNAPYVP